MVPVERMNEEDDTRYKTRSGNYMQSRLPFGKHYSDKESSKPAIKQETFRETLSRAPENLQIILVLRSDGVLYFNDNDGENYTLSKISVPQ